MKKPSARYLSGIFDPDEIPPEHISPLKAENEGEKSEADNTPNELVTPDVCAFTAAEKDESNLKN